MSEALRVHQLSLGSANAYLLESDAGVYLVDTGLPGYASKVTHKLRSLDGKPLRLIYITHAHLDHFGNAAFLSRQTGAPIAIHQEDSPAMEDGRTVLGDSRGRGRFISLFFPLFARMFRPETTRATLKLDDGDTLSEFGLDAKVIHTPGHTPGSSCLLVNEQIAFAGDLVSTTGRPHYQRYFAQDWSELQSSVERLKALNPLVTYPGHGRKPLERSSLDRL